MPGLSKKVVVRGQPADQLRRMTWRGTDTKICLLSWAERDKDALFRAYVLTALDTACENDELVRFANSLEELRAPND
jgi:hypothetical protein